MASLWEPVCGVYSSSASFLPCLGWLENFGNSSFFTTVFGALAGAFAGAWAAQRIAAKNKLQEEMLKEIRSTNSAILLGQAVFNVGFGSKLGGSLPLKTAYDEEVQIFKENPADFPNILKRQVNLAKITCASTPISELYSLILTEVSSSTGAVRALLHLKMAIDGHLEAHAHRNGLIDIFERKTIPEGLTFADMYFGETRDGVAHRAYADSIRDIYQTADDMLFYSKKMCDYLHQHAIELRKRYKKVSRNKVTVARLIISSDIDPSLIPGDESYAAWLTGYQPAQNVSNTHWWHLRRK